MHVKLQDASELSLLLHEISNRLILHFALLRERETEVHLRTSISPMPPSSVVLDVMTASTFLASVHYT